MKSFIVLSICALLVCAHAAGIPEVQHLDDDAELLTHIETSFNKFEGEIEQNNKSMETAVTNERNNDEMESDEKSEEEGEEDNLTSVRVPRFTCDVLSFKSKIVSPNHSACAVRCISLRRRGGSCKKGICVCRGKKW